MPHRSDDDRRSSRLRRRRRVELASQWPHLITAVGLGVALPIMVGIPSTDRAFGDRGDELGIVIVMIAAIAGLFLVLAAISGRRSRELLLAGVAFGVAAAHPGIDFVFGSVGDNPLTLGRAALGATAAALAAVLAGGNHAAVSALRMLTVSVAVLAVVLYAIEEFSSAPHLAPAAALLLAFACVLGGGLAHVRGVLAVDGGLIAIGVLTMSAGLGTALTLVGGQTGLTVGVATLTMVSVILAAVAALMAFLDALERRDQARDIQRLARSLELARLTAQSERHAELAHDQRTALLAIEAAAIRLREHPSDGLADAVAIEAARLQRMLDGASAEQGRFAVDRVVSPVVTCLTALYGPISIEVTGSPYAWGDIDDTAEIVRALVDNAHEHGGPNVSVHVVGSDDAVVVRVTDDGDGVPPVFCEVIFDRGITSDPRSHTGLGLFAARRLARAAGGDLTITPDNTAAFELRLPTRPPDTTVISLEAHPDEHPDVGSLNG